MPRFVPGTVASPELAATVTFPKESKLAELGRDQDGMIGRLQSHGAVRFRMAARRTFLKFEPTIIYLHVIQRPGAGPPSPLDYQP